MKNVLKVLWVTSFSDLRIEIVQLWDFDEIERKDDNNKDNRKAATDTNTGILLLSYIHLILLYIIHYRFLKLRLAISQYLFNNNYRAFINSLFWYISFITYNSFIQDKAFGKIIIYASYINFKWLTYCS